MQLEGYLEKKYIFPHQGNESAESTLVPLQNGIVNFNQTLRLSVNMYFDTNTNKFV